MLVKIEEILFKIGEAAYNMASKILYSAEEK